LTVGRGGCLEWAVAERPLPGEHRSGDDHLVATTTTGWLLAVADGLGHGRDAAVASDACVAILARNPDAPVIELVHECHERLRSTRGIALALASVDRRRGLLCWVGVGNVEGVVRHIDSDIARSDYITMRGGIVGYRLPTLSTSSLELRDGDTLVLATDGIGDGFVHGIVPHHPPKAIATNTLAAYAKPSDDALVLVARWHADADEHQSPS
jgi:serine/threonine protein phosphatase PrpC